MKDELFELGRRYGSDKFTSHGYHRYYTPLLQPLRNKPIRLLEVGIDRGSSLQLWLEYFPRATIYGMDRSTESEGERFRVYQGDQSRREDLRKVLALIDGSLDIVIDDGSHVPAHQLLTFSEFFPRVSAGGIYIIEDIETSYWSNGEIYGYAVKHGYRHSQSTVEVFKQLLDVVNIKFLTESALSVLEETLASFGLQLATVREIANLRFGQNCIIVTRRDSTDGEFDRRIYPLNLVSD